MSERRLFKGPHVTVGGGCGGFPVSGGIRRFLFRVVFFSRARYIVFT